MRFPLRKRASRRIATRDAAHSNADCKTIEDYDRETLTNALRAVL